MYSFLGDLHRILHPDYLPSHTDVLKSPITIEGLREHFIQDSKPTWRVHEVVGEPGDQRFWSNLPHNMTFLIIIIDVSLCTPVLLEAHELPDRLHKDLTLFNRICRLQQYSRVPVALVLNSVDVLRRGWADTSIPSLSLKDLQKASSERLLEMFKREFSLCCPEQRPLYTHFTISGEHKSIVQFVRRVTIQAVVSNGLERHVPTMLPTF